MAGDWKRAVGIGLGIVIAALLPGLAFGGEAVLPSEAAIQSQVEEPSGSGF
ncbi:MAG: hypothetical protein AAF675_09335 [Pseudomonadota bacterium]